MICFVEDHRIAFHGHRPDGRVVHCQVCDHARHGYATASRFGAAICGGDGTSVESSAIRSRRPNWSTRGMVSCNPRVAVSLPGTNRSRYARLNGSEPGIDPYTRAVSDVYQDLFGEGSFIGKGIYEVDAFEQRSHGASAGESDPQSRSSGRLLMREQGC